MSENAISHSSIRLKNLHTISVWDIRLGMILHAIDKQVGKLSVKNVGEVKHLDIIDKLSKRGVKTVVIEDAPHKTKTILSALKPSNWDLFASKPVLSLRNHTSQSGRSELAEPSSLIAKSNEVFANFQWAAEQGIPLDFTPTSKIASGIYQNIANEPEALLCTLMNMPSKNYLAKHSIVVASLLCYFAHQLGMPKNQCQQLALLGYLFDIGMLKVAQSVIQKHGPLSTKEQVDIQAHVAESLKILAPLKLERELLLAVEQHHERLDGSGYPNAETGSKIHKYSRMLAIVDGYDALTSSRKHKCALSPAAAMKVLSNSASTYDQKLVLQFIRCMGIYPVGSLVLLSNRCIGLVTKNNKASAILPKVTVFYSTVTGQFVHHTDLDLAKPGLEGSGSKSLRVIKPVLASQYGLNIDKIIF